MRTAPAVSVTLGPDGPWRLGLALFSVCAPLIAGLWWLSHARALISGLPDAPVDWPAWLLASCSLLVVCMAAIACRHLRVAPGQRLSWSGIHWTLVDRLGASHVGHVSVAVDLGRWMLLRFDLPLEPPLRLKRSAAWIAISERALPAQWHDLRCALFADHDHDR